jgi:hypothetical protein
MDQFLAHFSFKIEILNDNSLSLGFTGLSLSISDLSVVFSDFSKKNIFNFDFLIIIDRFLVN